MLESYKTAIVLLGLFVVIYCKPNKCPISLPQHVPRGSVCYKLRYEYLALQRVIFSIKGPTNEVPFSHLNVSIAKYSAFLKKNPFQSLHAQLWLGQAKVAGKLAFAYLRKTGRLPKIMKLPEYAPVTQFFKTSMEAILDNFVKVPSSVEPFQSDMTKWISDRLFAEQRLAGVNPMTIQRVTFSRKIGMHWDKLEKMLNRKFNLIAAVSRLLKNVYDKRSLMQAIRKGHLFVLHHPLSDNISSMADIAENHPNRTLREYMSPVAIFASMPSYYDFFEPRTHFMPVAIQMDNKPDSPVFTPSDGDMWMMAKLTVQQTDLQTSQTVEHLSKVHMISEVLCLSIERQLSKKHPLYAIMKYHCRGIYTTNTLGTPVLLAPQQQLHRVYAMGHKGSNFLLKSTSKTVVWGDLNMEANIKRRGMDDHHRLPYYPYRDDGKIILGAIREMVFDYVNTYYPMNLEVKDDKELQNFANEVSEEGSGPNGGKGHLRGFPAKITSKRKLVETFTQMIWLMSAQHSAINYPLADYGAYVPNTPLKLYDDNRVPNDKFSGARLPNRVNTAGYMAFELSLGTFRYDRLFDYGEFLDDPEARQVLYFHFSKLTEEVEPRLQWTNNMRLKQGHLTYPYMLPRWLTNGVQT